MSSIYPCSSLERGEDWMWCYEHDEQVG